ncbi:Hypothetical protein D9617_2g055930 [Elsinoe fawcettii]|nr:Hypothetical protein D9617_2g055930 [Elsinoe fawcettii]
MPPPHTLPLLLLLLVSTLSSLASADLLPAISRRTSPNPSLFSKRQGCTGTPFLNSFCCSKSTYCFAGETCCANSFCCPGGSTCVEATYQCSGRGEGFGTGIEGAVSASSGAAGTGGSGRGGNGTTVTMAATRAGTAVATGLGTTTGTGAVVTASSGTARASLSPVAYTGAAGRVDAWSLGEVMGAVSVVVALMVGLGVGMF